MNETLILVWVAILIIGIIAIIIVKMYFNDKKDEEVEYSDFTSTPLQEMVSENKKINLKNTLTTLQTIFQKKKNQSLVFVKKEHNQIKNLIRILFQRIVFLIETLAILPKTKC